MKAFLKFGWATFLIVVGIGYASAGVYSSDHAITQQQYEFNKQQVIALVDSVAVQEKLTSLGVDPADAKMRVDSMTNDELIAFNQNMNEMPAGGIVGAVVTVLAVIAILDLLGVTDVYPFIRPIN
jgi:hypothetical protein